MYDPLMNLECPLCHALTAQVLHEFISAADYHPSCTRIVRCAACRVLHTDPMPDAQALAFLYARPGHQQMLADPGDEGLRTRLTRERFALFAARIPSGRVLDVGCGAGTFLRVAGEYGYLVQGIEADPARAQQARHASGAEVFLGDVISCDSDLAGFDLITFWDVFEHLPQPALVLQRCLELLKPGGCLALLVPNAGCRLAHALGAQWAGWCVPFHLYHYCCETLMVLLQRAEFEMLEMRAVSSHWIAEHSLLRLAGWADTRSGILSGCPKLSDRALRAGMAAHFGPDGDDPVSRLAWLRHRLGLPAAASDGEIFVLARKS